MSELGGSSENDQPPPVSGILPHPQACSGPAVVLEGDMETGYLRAELGPRMRRCVEIADTMADGWTEEIDALLPDLPTAMVTVQIAARRIVMLERELARQKIVSVCMYCKHVLESDTHELSDGICGDCIEKHHPEDMTE